ncbi:MAG: hypothetical protein J6J33_05960 [Clostridia bacterium]|nr:hypothetical protein [Clostridia bacterium]
MSRYNKTFNWKLVVGIIIGLLSAVALFCLSAAIGCAVNGISFGEQIVKWFGSNSETVKDVADTVASKLIVK